MNRRICFIFLSWRTHNRSWVFPAATNPRLCYLGASACGAATAGLVASCFEETLPRHKRIRREHCRSHVLLAPPLP